MISIKEINLNKFNVIRDKYNRIDEMGVNHGRSIYHDSENKLYYKIFHRDYCRRNNFELAIRKDFFKDLAPGLKDLIEDDGDIIGYVTEEGNILSNSEFDNYLIPAEFKEKLFDSIRKTNLFFYDFVPSNIIILEDGRFSLIDLESVYEIKDLFKIHKHNAKIKPDFLYDFIYNKWKEYVHTWNTK